MERRGGAGAVPAPVAISINARGRSATSDSTRPVIALIWFGRRPCRRRLLPGRESDRISVGLLLRADQADALSLGFDHTDERALDVEQVVGPAAPC